MKIRVRSPNLDRVVGHLKALVTGIPIATKQSSRIIAEQILLDSKTKPPMCPVDTQALEATGRVEAVREGYAVVYGGAAPGGAFVDYAGYVHDDLRPRRYQKPGSGPKFVEAHFIQQSETAPVRIAGILEELAASIITLGR